MPFPPMQRFLSLLFGKPKDPADPRVLHGMSLVAFFAWVGLGADGLSSSCYGPEEAFLALEGHRHLAIPLAILVAVTVMSISASYSQVVSMFPAGGGGYIVATKLLGAFPGQLSGTSLLVDYVLTIAISCASGVDALFSFAPPSWQPAKMYATLALVILLIVLNLRGVKESITVLLPLFMTFVITHLVLLILAFAGNAGLVSERFAASSQQMNSDVAASGFWPLAFIVIKAFALGGGTFTGIEAVSNSMQIFREPKAATARRTMLYMAVSLAVTAAGILLAYYVLDVHHEAGRTLNATLFNRIAGAGGAGATLVTVALIAEGGLLFVAAQAGFIDGPRVLATMAVDGWVPRQFSRLSDRLVVQNGVLLMGLGAVLFILLTRASVKVLVVLYSISVFITFVLTQFGLVLHWLKTKDAPRRWLKAALNSWGLLLTLTILVASVIIKLPEGAWISLLVILAVLGVTSLIRTHYRRTAQLLATLDRQMFEVDPGPAKAEAAVSDPQAATAILLVSGWNGLGLHALMTIYRMFPGQFRNVVFVSAAIVDYDRLRGEHEIEHLRAQTEEGLKKYVSFAHRAGFAAEYQMAVGTDPVDEVVEMCSKISQKYNRSVAFAGQLAFPHETVWTRMLHSQVAFEIQRRLQFSGLPLVILPVRAVERKQPASQLTR